MRRASLVLNVRLIYGYDGFGSVRTLTDINGTVTDSYDFDAWGNAVNVTGSTPNLYRYRGEQYDSDLNLYYLRARYFNPLTGRFLTRDPEAGGTRKPSTFHRYLYAGADPVTKTDPSGRREYELTLIVGGSGSYWITWRIGVAIAATIATLVEYLMYGYGPEATPPPEHNPDGESQGQAGQPSETAPMSGPAPGRGNRYPQRPGEFYPLEPLEPVR
jgi:RHS repeat-associated protein